jgi:CheY-like chemotaxis protein
MPALPLSILFVEDHPSTNETMTRMLRKRGHTVSSAGTAAVALKLMEQNKRFDLLISDIGLPDTDGWELLLKLRAIQPSLRAMAITGFGFATDIKRSEGVGFELHLTKPVDWAVVEKAIGSMFPGAMTPNQDVAATGG